MTFRKFVDASTTFLSNTDDEAQDSLSINTVVDNLHNQVIANVSSIVIESILRQDKRREIECVNARKINIVYLVLVLLLVFFDVSMLAT